MTWFVGAALIISFLLGLAFVLILGPPWRSENVTMAWLQASLAWVAIWFDGMLILAHFGLRIPTWPIILWLLLQDAVFGWRLWVLLGIQRRRDRDVPEQS